MADDEYTPPSAAIGPSGELIPLDDIDDAVRLETIIDAARERLSFALDRGGALVTDPLDVLLDLVDDLAVSYRVAVDALHEHEIRQDERRRLADLFLANGDVMRTLGDGTGVPVEVLATMLRLGGPPAP